MMNDIQEAKDFAHIQEVADMVLEQWTEGCGKVGAYLAQEMEALSGRVELPSETAKELTEFCELNMKIGVFLNLYALKVRYISDPKVAKELVGDYKEIHEAVNKGYLKELKELANEIRTEHGLDDLSDEVTKLYEAIDKLATPLKKIQLTLQKSTGPVK